MQQGIDRLLEKRWGVFNHFLYNPPGSSMDFGPDTVDWNERVNQLDVELIARQLHEMGAGYYFITVMQGRKYMLAPNATYDRIAGTRPGEACAKRDVISDLYTALSEYDIDLYLYFTGDGPYKDEEIGIRFGFINPRQNISVEFVEKWASVLEEYSVRYGNKVKGWWIDGCYDFFGYDQDKLALYAKAIKNGNPNAIAAFNNGVKDTLEKWYVQEEYVCGEFNDFVYLPKERFIQGAQAHILAPLGKLRTGEIYSAWGQKGTRHDHTYMKNYVTAANQRGCPVTIDIYIGENGAFDSVQTAVLTGI